MTAADVPAAVAAVIDRAGRLSANEVTGLVAAWRAAAGTDALGVAQRTVWAAYYAAYNTHRFARVSAVAASVAAISTTATSNAAGDAAFDAAFALALWDLAGQHGLTQTHLDTLLGPWTSVFGHPLEVPA